MLKAVSPWSNIEVATLATCLAFPSIREILAVLYDPCRVLTLRFLPSSRIITSSHDKVRIPTVYLLRHYGLTILYSELSFWISDTALTYRPSSNQHPQRQMHSRNGWYLSRYARSFLTCTFTFTWTWKADNLRSLIQSICSLLPHYGADVFCCCFEHASVTLSDVLFQRLCFSVPRLCFGPVSLTTLSLALWLLISSLWTGSLSRGPFALDPARKVNGVIRPL